MFQYSKKFNIFLFAFALLALVFVLFTPIVTQAQNLIVCDGDNCSIAKFVELVQVFINFVTFTLAIPISAVLLGYGGFLMITARGNQSQVDSAKTAFKSAIGGLVIILVAWLLVYTIVETLISPDFRIPEEVKLES